jgi:Lon protease-like protein
MTARLPLFPLGTVLFPGLVLPLHIFEPRYRDLVRDLLALPAEQAREFGVVAIQRGWEVGEQAVEGDTTAPVASASLTLHEVGCTAEIRQVTELPDGRFDLATVGRRRFRIARVDPAVASYLVAEVEWLPEPGGQEEAADLLAPRVLASFRQYLGLMRDSRSAGSPGEGEVGEQLPENPTVLSHLVAATAALTLADRQRLLAARDTATRLRAELRLLARESALLRQVRAVPVPLSELAVPPSSN